MQETIDSHYRDRMLIRSGIIIPLSLLMISNLALVCITYPYLKAAYSMSTSTAHNSSHLDDQNSSSHNFRTITRRKVILLWNLPKMVSYPESLQKGRCDDCVITKDKTLFNISDAIVFNFRGIKNEADIPPRLSSATDRVYVWLCRESPKTTLHSYNYDLSNLNGVFNWTMTHRMDSDVFYPYVEMLHRMHDEKYMNSGNATRHPFPFVDLYYSNVNQLIQKKKYLVAWVVGNCGGTPGAKKRMDIVNKLVRAGLPVHRFGKCFKSKNFPPYRSEEAHERLSEYKFYLAFENTHGCRDYVTYKFWKNAIYSGAVPIVWGSRKEDIARLAPKHSYIHLEDYNSIQDLIKHLKYLDQNTMAYKEYLTWREKELNCSIAQTENRSRSDWILSTTEAFGFCKLCRMLHAKDKTIPTGEIFHRKTIQSLSNWWYESEESECVSKY